MVGATACTLLQSSLLEGCSFAVVVLDECSQMTEPLSLVPLLRAKARWGYAKVWVCHGPGHCVLVCLMRISGCTHRALFERAAPGSTG